MWLAWALDGWLKGRILTAYPFIRRFYFACCFACGEEYLCIFSEAIAKVLAVLGYYGSLALALDVYIDTHDGTGNTTKMIWHSCMDGRSIEVE